MRKSKTVLGDICKITMGQSPDSSTYHTTNIGLPFYQGNADFGELYPKTRIWCSQPQKIAEPENILLSVRAPIGALNIAKEKCCIGRGLAAIAPHKNFCFNKYLFYILKYKHNELNARGTGSTFKAINKSILNDLPIDIYPIDRQKRIAAILDKATELIALRKQQIQKLDLLVKSRFIEMFGNTQTNPKDLSLMPWCDVFLTTTGKLDSNAMVKNGQYPFFTCAKECFRIDTYAFNCEALLLAGNNAAGIYDVKYYKGKFNAYQRTYVLRLINKQWSYKLFKIQLEDKLLYLQNQSKGSNTRYLTLGILNKLQFIVPPISEQNTFEAFVTQVDKSKSTLQQSLEKLKLNYKALMQTYFG